MNPKSLLELSNYLSTLDFPDKLSFHAVRYAYFVRNSKLGINCIYAKKTLEMFDKLDESSKLRELFKNNPKVIGMLDVT